MFVCLDEWWWHVCDLHNPWNWFQFDLVLLPHLRLSLHLSLYLCHSLTLHRHHNGFIWDHQRLLSKWLPHDSSSGMFSHNQIKSPIVWHCFSDMSFIFLSHRPSSRSVLKNLHHPISNKRETIVWHNSFLIVSQNVAPVAEIHMMPFSLQSIIHSNRTSL